MLDGKSSGTVDESKFLENSLGTRHLMIHNDGDLELTNAQFRGMEIGEETGLMKSSYGGKFTVSGTEFKDLKIRATIPMIWLNT